ncbi:MAG: hypothetical protein U1F76_22000 [Candidatus Competibacteraceae bacterium]
MISWNVAAVVTAHLRYQQGGTDKEWCCEATAQGVTIRYGKTGSRLRQTVIPVATCVQRDPRQEAQRRIREKLAKGYQPVPTTSAPRSTDPEGLAATTTTAPLRLWWEMLPSQDITTVVQTLLAPFAALDVQIKSRPTGVALRVGEESLTILTRPPLRSGGELTQPLLALVLLALARALPDAVRLADTANQPVDPAAFARAATWLQGREDWQAVARVCGLLPIPPVLAAAGHEPPGWFF